MIKFPNFQEDITVLNVFESSDRMPNTLRQNLIELQGETDKSISIVWNFNTTPLSQRISKDITESNSTINQVDIIDIHRLHHPTTAEYTFFLSSHGTFTKINRILHHKTHINKFKENIKHTVFAFRPQWN